MPGWLSSLARTWLLLIALTFASTFIAEGFGHPVVTAVMIFSIAGAKAEWLLSSYMEVDKAAPYWSRLFPVWAIAISVVLIGGHVA